MSALFDWVSSHPGELMTAADYEALPEEESRRIEIVDGAVILTPSPGRAHQTISFSLAGALKAAVRGRFIVSTDVDLRLSDVPARVRRPDVVVFDRSLPDDATLRPKHCLLVVEVVSPGSETTDLLYKAIDYATAGIEHYWRVEELNPDKHTMTLYRYRLDRGTHKYAPAGVDTSVLSVGDPFELTIDLADLY